MQTRTGISRTSRWNFAYKAFDWQESLTRETEGWIVGLSVDEDVELLELPRRQSVTPKNPIVVALGRTLRGNLDSQIVAVLPERQKKRQKQIQRPNLNASFIPHTCRARRPRRTR